MKSKFYVLLFIFALPKLLLAISEKDFAYMAEITTSSTTPYYEMEIPTRVYETITRSDLGDMRVLNANNEVVPHGLRLPALIRNEKTDAVRVPFFPLYQQAGQSGNDLQLNIQRNDKGDIINIHNRPATENKDKRLAGYLLDLREWDKPVQKLKINWKNPENKSFIRKLRVAQSHDLERWQHVASGKTLVNMSYQNHKLKENTINLRAINTNYLRLTFEDEEDGLEFESVAVSFTQEIRQKQQNWKTVSLKANAETGEYTFKNNLKTLARELSIKLPQNNTVVKAVIFSRVDDKQPWQQRGSALLYRLTVNGNSIEKSKVAISSQRDKYWMIRFDQQGGGIGSGLPIVKFSWYPQQLVFVARGDAPFHLAWGSTHVNPVKLNANQLLPNINSASISQENIISTAQLLTDTMRTVNAKMLQPKEKEPDWKNWILWSVLTLSALMLIWMAVRLMKKMAD